MTHDLDLQKLRLAEFHGGLRLPSLRQGNPAQQVRENHPEKDPEAEQTRKVILNKPRFSGDSTKEAGTRWGPVSFAVRCCPEPKLYVLRFLCFVFNSQ